MQRQVPFPLRLGLDRLALAALVLLTGCYSSNFSWRKVKNSDAPGHFTWRTDTELWGDGPSVARRRNGAWEALDVCGPYLKSHGFAGNRAVTTVGFGADGSVFALCGGDLTDGQDLVHFNAAGDGVAMVLPNDGAVTLVQLQGDIALMGSSHLYQRKGDAFTEVAAHPFASAPQAAGLSLQEIYATGTGPNAQATKWWNGSSWADVNVPNTARPGEPPDQAFPPILRAGTIGLGPWQVVHGVPKLFVHDNPGVQKRPVRFLAALPPDSALYYGTSAHDSFNASTVLYLWLARSGDSDLEFLGDGPFSSGSMYSVGGFGGYAIDEATVLMSSTHGAVGSKATTELWEGGL